MRRETVTAIIRDVFCEIMLIACTRWTHVRAEIKTLLSPTNFNHWKSIVFSIYSLASR